MSDTNDKNPSAPRRPLTLKGGTGTIRQNFSGGRSKSVVVEKKKRRVIMPGGKTPAASTAPSDAAKPVVKIDEVAEAAKQLGLSKDEYVKRQAAISKANAEQTSREERRLAEEAERKRRMDEEKAALEIKRKSEEEAELRRLQEEEEERKREEAEAARRAPTPAQKILDQDDEKLTEVEKAGGRVKKKRAPSMPSNRSSKPNPRRRQGKLTIVSALAGDDERQRSLASMRRAREKERRVSAVDLSAKNASMKLSCLKQLLFLIWQTG